MELRAVVHNGQIILPVSVDVPDGTEVQVLVDDALLAKPSIRQPIEREPLDEADVMADLRWATGQRFA